jgi:hypothetical protein
MRGAGRFGKKRLAESVFSEFVFAEPTNRFGNSLHSLSLSEL